MDSIYQRGRASAADVQSDIPEPPSNSAVRAMLAILVEKGILKTEKDGPRYVYLPTRTRAVAGKSAMKNVVETFFDGSVGKAVTALLDSHSRELSPDDLNNLQRVIQQARKEGR